MFSKLYNDWSPFPAFSFGLDVNRQTPPGLTWSSFAPGWRWREI
jgi:hypothetical protein